MAKSMCTVFLFVIILLISTDDVKSKIPKGKAHCVGVPNESASRSCGVPGTVQHNGCSTTCVTLGFIRGACDGNICKCYDCQA
ncbi:unnamed protein product [Eruca vesicaria subsp. sativa]|uniref:Uncharacterized protein n=1 Tax=Eruca vesicaria subsp. sativa TaxID=29727 RepID=A0ABC8LFB1_ERUVS|nr:unnamed protein product [Eruca vesicaria subsp. sativa]